MKKQLFVVLFLTILIFNISQGSAFFVKSHIYWTAKSFRETNSPITQLCADRLDLIMDGDTATDVPVLHYYDDKFLSYISTHTRGTGYQECLAEAGSDVESICFCYGVGLHNVQDHYAHTEVGLVPKYLKSSVAPNLVGHMAIERDFENKHMAYLREQNDPIVMEGTLDFYDSIVLDNMFEQTGGDEKYVKLLNDMTGLDTRNDINIFANGYKGQGFYDTVYNEKLKLPWWFWGISIGAMIIGFGMALLIIFTAKTYWRFIAILPWVVMGILGLMILISFFTANTWAWINFAVEIPPKFGLLSVSEKDVIDYNNVVLEQSKRFLETGELNFDDNSGLSYVDRDGTQVKGALGEAERNFKYILLPLIAMLFAIVQVFLFLAAYSVRGDPKKHGFIALGITGGIVVLLLLFGVIF